MMLGVPYKGSKNQIARWVIDNLPEDEILIDLFAGGCAVTHAAMLSGKWDRIVANDIGDAPELFKGSLVYLRSRSPACVFFLHCSPSFSISLRILLVPCAMFLCTFPKGIDSLSLISR